MTLAEIALTHHTRLACETMHPRFMVIQGATSLLLTVQSGWE